MTGRRQNRDSVFHKKFYRVEKTYMLSKKTQPRKIYPMPEGGGENENTCFELREFFH